MIDLEKVKNIPDHGNVGTDLDGIKIALQTQLEVVLLDRFEFLGIVPS